MLRELFLTAAAASLVATPVAARPVPRNPAAALSLKNAVPASARTSTAQGKNKLLGGGVFVAVIAAAAVILGIIIVANEDDSDSN